MHVGPGRIVPCKVEGVILQGENVEFWVGPLLDPNTEYASVSCKHIFA